MTLISFVLAHLGASVVAEAALDLAGYVVFSDDEGENPLVLTTSHKTRLYSYIVLLDVMSKALVAKVTQSDYSKVVEKAKSLLVKKEENV
jgi:hypothetical protein